METTRQKQQTETQGKITNAGRELTENMVIGNGNRKS